MSDDTVEPVMTHFKKTSGRRRGGNTAQRTFATNVDEEVITPPSDELIQAAAEHVAAHPESAIIPTTTKSHVAAPPTSTAKTTTSSTTSTTSKPPSMPKSGPPPLNTQSSLPPPLTSQSSLPPSMPNTPSTAITAQGAIPNFSRQATFNQGPTKSIQYTQAKATGFKSMEQRLNQVRSAQLKPINNDTNINRVQKIDDMLIRIPTCFQHTSIKPQPPGRTSDQVFLCGPLGAAGPVSATDSKKREFKPKWGVLYRDRLDVYSKWNDSKPSTSWSLTGCLAQATRDANDNSQAISITNGKETFYVRVELPTQQTLPPNTNATQPPTLPQQHSAWFNAIRVRIANLEYLNKCRSASIVPDERLLSLYDAQHKAPFSLQLITAFSTADLYVKIPKIPSQFITQDGVHPITNLPFEGYCADLGGGKLSSDAISSLCALFTDPEYLPIFAVKFDDCQFPLDDVNRLLQALINNPQDNFIQLDLGGADCIEDDMNGVAEMLGRLLCSTKLQHFQRLFIRNSRLNTTFCTELNNAVQQNGGVINVNLTVIDLSSNNLENQSFTPLLDLLSNSINVSSSLQHLNLSWNPFTDLTSLSKWLTLQKPSSSTYILQQEQDAPYKPIHLQGLYLQGSAATEDSFIILARSLLWHICLTHLDLSQCTRLQENAQSAITQALQINESLQVVKYAQYKITTQGLTAMRLFYRYGAAISQTQAFGAEYSQFSLIGFAYENYVE